MSALNPTKGKMAEAADLVHAAMGPTPQISWPLLSARAGTEVWVKHENHLPTGAFKARGGVIYMAPAPQVGAERQRRHRRHPRQSRPERRLRCGAQWIERHHR